MDLATVVDICHQALWMVVLISAPLLVAALAVGLVIGIITGVLLGVARASGETAPLLFTSLGNQFFSTALNEPISAIPQLIYQRTIQVATPASLQLAWGAALVLVAIIFILNIGGALISRRSRTLEAR